MGGSHHGDVCPSPRGAHLATSGTLSPAGTRRQLCWASQGHVPSDEAARRQIGQRGLWLSAIARKGPSPRPQECTQNVHPGTWLRNAPRGAGRREHPSSLPSGNDRTRLPSSLLGSHNRSFNGRPVLADAGGCGASRRGRVDVLVLERGQRLPPEGEVTERVRAGEVRGMAPLQQREDVVNHFTESHVPGRTRTRSPPAGTPAQGSTRHAPAPSRNQERPTGLRPDPGANAAEGALEWPSRISRRPQGAPAG